MIKSSKSLYFRSTQPSFEQYPWAGNHKEAITCIARYMDIDTESVIRDLDERILGKVARDHL